MFLDKSLPNEVRLLAIIQLKNGIDRHWRLFNHVKGGLTEPEKAAIRSRLFQGTVEEDNKALALQNALAVAKVVRIDYQKAWPEALPSLIALLRTYKNGDENKVHGSLQVVLRVVKEMSTARLRTSQTALQGITPELSHILGEMYAERATVWVDSLSKGMTDPGAVELAMHNSLSCVRILRRLFTTGYESPYKDETVSNFWSITQTHFSHFFSFIGQASIPANYRNLVGKHLLQFAKLHVTMADSHPASFTALPNSLPLIHAYWDLVVKFAEVFDSSAGIPQSTTKGGQAKYEEEGPLLERLTLMALTLLRICVKIAHRPFQSFRYRSDDEKKDRETAVELLKTQWLTNDFVTQITNTLITRLFLFRKSDLDAWEQDPEEWEQREQGEGNAYEFEVRPCAEKLFLDFLTSYKDLLIPPLLGYFNASTDPNADLTTKEAVYTAMGLAAAHLSTYFNNNKPESEGRQNIDFDSFLETTLVRDSQQQGPLAKVLRRRIGILLSQWVTVQSTERNRPVIYQLFTHFMNPNDECNDLVVRITAARQLRWVVDEMYFDVDKFLPFATDVMSQLADLVSTIDVDESKLAILETMRLLVTRIENHATHFADFLMSALPQIWEASGTEEFMIKQAVIAIFSALVMSMGPESQRYQHHIVPLIAESARPGSGLHGHLIDESLELWNSVVMQSNPPLSAELVNIYELAIPLLEYETETASASLDLVESYILMAPEAILEDRFRRPTLIGLGELLKSQSRERVRQATVCIEYVIRSATELGGVSGVTVVLQDLMEIGLLGAILEALHDAWDAHQTTGPNRRISKLNTVTEGDYFAILSRLALAEPNAFAQVLSRFGPVDGVWSWLVGEWFSHLGAMDFAARQKLYLLGLTRFLELGEPIQPLVLNKLQDYLTMWTNIISDLQDGEETDCLITTELPPEEWHCPKNTRENELMLKDPVHSVHAFEFVKARIADVVQRVGGEQRFQEDWVANVDRDVMDRFQQLSQFMASKGK